MVLILSVMHRWGMQPNRRNLLTSRKGRTGGLRDFKALIERENVEFGMDQLSKICLWTSFHCNGQTTLRACDVAVMSTHA